jgi:hypothetical protein
MQAPRFLALTRLHGFARSCARGTRLGLALLVLAPACSSPGGKDVNLGRADAGRLPDADAEVEPQSDEPDAAPEGVDAQAATNDAGASDAAQDAAQADTGAGTDASSDAAPSADGGSDAAVGSDASAGFAKSRCGAPTSIDNAVRIASFPILRARPGGNVAVTWQEIDANNAPYRNVVRAFVGGAFGAQHILSENGVSRTEAAIDDQGNIHAHWSEGASGTDREYEDYNASTGQWSGKAQWFTNRGSEITLPLPMFALNHAGLTLHTMFYNLNGSATAGVAFFDPTAGQWSAIHPLGDSANNTGVGIPTAGINDAGQGVAVWLYTDNTTGQNLRSLRASSFASGNFSAPVSVSGGTQFLGMTVLAGGDMLVAYANTDRVSARRFSPAAGAGQEWGPEQTVDMMQPGAPTLVVDAADNVTAVWASGQTVRAARYQAGTWQPAAALGFTDLGFSVGIDGSGNVSVVYGAYSAPIKLRRMSASGGAWTDAIDVANETGTVQVPQVAHDASGNVIVIYGLGRALPQGGTDSHIRWVVCE